MIRTLNKNKRYKYLHTCGRCGGHVASFVSSGPGFAPDVMKLCSLCGWVFPEDMEKEAGRADAESQYIVPGVERLCSRRSMFASSLGKRVPLPQDEKRNPPHRKSGFGGREMENKKGPVFRTRSGRFQVSIWRRLETIPAEHDFDAERQRVITRVCVQHSKWNRISGGWNNQDIWCGVCELRDLVQALDKLNDVGLLDRQCSQGDASAAAVSGR